MSTIIKSVLVPYPVDRPYDYRVADGMGVSDGDYVLVPLGARHVVGVVWGDGGGDKIASSKIKDIIARYDVSPLPVDHRAFLDWAARYTMTERGSILKLTLSAPTALDAPKDIKLLQIAAPSPQPSPLWGEGDNQSKALSPQGRGMGEGEERLSPKQKAVMAIAQDGATRSLSQLAQESGVSTAILKTMVKKGWLRETIVPETPPCTSPTLDFAPKAFSPAQGIAAKILREAVAAKGFSSFLLDGVTGSGKTEVYFEAVAQALSTGRQALILLPEIALSNAFLARFKDRFGCEPALWHSSLSDHQRKITWRGVASGACKVVVGARSALFLPYQSLGVIIVDEEHDPAYKQEEGVIYNARDLAVVRAHYARCPVILVSATPSLETMHNIWIGKYQHLSLPNRHGTAGMPDIHILDLKKDKPERNHFIAPSLKAAMKDTMEEEGGQVLLFLNRRGYAPLTLCRACGHRFECPRCTAWLIEHKKTGKLHCHHCGYDTKIPPACPACGEKESLVPCGPGIERILEEVKESFPDKSTLVLSSDTATTYAQLKQMLSDIRDHKADIIIGTQMIAKGHHFPKLTCVGVIDADLGLSGGDLRAGERTFQLLHQVAGRAGREAEKGHVYLQTYAPEMRVIQALAAQKRDDFLSVEAAERESAHMPPYSRLAGIIVSGRDERMVTDISNKLGQTAPHGTGLSTLGPADAPLYRLRGKFRRRLLIRADKTIDIQKTITHWISAIKIPASVRVQIDIDPQSFF